MIASLPMYDLPELESATFGWWKGLSAWWKRLGMTNVPDTLDRPHDPYKHWLSPDLFFSQTCGYPLTHELKNKVTLVATPCYRAKGCKGAYYRSALIVAKDSSLSDLSELKGKRAAINGFDSHSGWNILRHSLRAFGPIKEFLGAILVTGSHRNSIKAIGSGRADIAAIDCVTLELLSCEAPQEMEGIRVLAWSDEAPSLPFIARAGIDAKELKILRDGLMEASRDPSLAVYRDRLRLDGFALLPQDVYDKILEQEEVAP